VIQERPNTVTRTKELWIAKLGRPASDVEVRKASECDTERAAHSGAGWLLEIVQAESNPAKPVDFEDWLASILVDYWCSIRGGGDGNQ